MSAPKTSKKKKTTQKKKAAPKKKAVAKKKAVTKKAASKKKAPNKKAAPKKKNASESRVKPTKKEKEAESTQKIDAIESKDLPSENSGDSKDAQIPEQTTAPASESASEEIVLEPVVVINSAAELHSRFCEMLEAGESVTIDASQVEMVDTAAFQLLVSFVLSMQKKDLTVKWRSPSTEFLERASILNLSEHLRLNESIA